ncbi:MAG: DeoR/GlpR transcriptional regulator [Flavobacteriaceae bacterium]|jgi:DeoR family transcriptional regulator of aga operon|nr:DeoR/GlpR transcriptional regulator [Flavobacteriaceae bacterium]
MTQAQRHQLIVELLKKKRFASVVDLAKHCDVSVVTIRKDLVILEQNGLVFKSHGGASIESPYVSDRSVSVKKLERTSEKEAIAQRAIDLISENDSIIIGSGTTVEAFSSLLPHMNLTVLTAAMNISMSLLNHPQIELVQLGGVVRKSSGSVVGPHTEAMLDYFNCKTLFIGADGVSFDHGCTTSNMMEAHLNSKMMEHVQKTILLVDSSKFDKKGFGKICDLKKIDVIITDKNIPNNYKQLTEELAIELIVV